MMTIKGAQRVLDYRVFKHKLGRFSEYRVMFKAKYEEFKIILSKLPNKRVMGAQHRYFQAEFRKFDIWFGNYQEIWYADFTFQKE